MAEREKVIVAMSGGVDSSFAAARLQEQGLTVVGAHFMLWRPGTQAASAAVDSAAQNAKRLGIELLTVDLRERFLGEVVEYFVSEYLAGRTPNPCSVCNPGIKFAALLRLADELSAGFVATGHYAVARRDSCKSETQLLEAEDKAKDQSYFLAFLDREALSRVIFPLGELTKAQVRDAAGQMGLPAAAREDSQDVCFALSRDYGRVIESLRPNAARSGDIVDLSGRRLGTHQGIWRYTIGQRRGLALNQPDLFVVSIDPVKNQVKVGKEQDLFHSKMKVSRMNKLAEFAAPLDCQVKIRYRSAKTRCRIEAEDNGEWLVSFSEPLRAVTPGQVAVFYREERVVAGAFIEGARD